MSLSRPTRANVTFTGAKTGGTGSATTRESEPGRADRRRLHLLDCDGLSCDHYRLDALGLQRYGRDRNSLADFNTALTAAGINLQASLTATDTLPFASTNDGARQTITTSTTVPGTVAANTSTLRPLMQRHRHLGSRRSGVAGHARLPGCSVQPDPQQITTTAQDSSFNGINLLNSDSLKLVFDETGKSSVTIAGVTFNPTGFGLSNLTAGTNFTDNVLTTKVLDALNTASVQLRAPLLWRLPISRGRLQLLR